MLFIGIKNIFRYNVFKFEHQQLKQELKTSQKQNNISKNELKKLNKKEFWEIQARKKLNFIKKGEQVYKWRLSPAQ
jgi:cell division protein FtsB